MQPGSTVLIYETSPTMSLVGWFVVDRVERKPLDELWDEVKSTAGVSLVEFNSYFNGVESGVAIHIRESDRIDTPIPLGGLQQMWPGFVAPQGFRYVVAPPRLLSKSRRVA